MDPYSYGYTAPILFSILALCACALFSFLETSITALRIFNLKQLSEQNTQYKGLFTTLEEEPQRVLIAILIANCLVNVIVADLITDIIQNGLSLIVPPAWSFVIGVSTATAAILFFGEIIPKSLAQSRSGSLFNSTLWLTNVIYNIFSPLVSLLSTLSSFMVSKVNQDKAADSLVSEREIKFLIEYINKSGQMDTDKSQMLHSIFELADTTIREIMVPQTDVVLLNVSSSIEDALDVFSKHHFSRLPVYEGKQDNIIGMLHQKDLFLLITKREKKPLKELMRPIFFVPESMKVNQLLRQFKQQRYHIAMVLNEYGGIIGLVTLEDAIEEIVGDINDEHESVADHIVSLERGEWLVYAGVPLEQLSQHLGISFDVEDAVSLGGFLTEQLQHLPKKGERLSYEGFVFQVQKATPKRVIQVLIFKEKSE